MSTALFALLFAIGAMAWVYNKMSRRAGISNAKPALIAALVVGVIAFIVFFSIFKLFLHG